MTQIESLTLRADSPSRSALNMLKPAVLDFEMGVSQALLTVTAGQEPLIAAKALVERLKSNGYAASFSRMIYSRAGIAIVNVFHVGENDEAILVQTGNASDLHESASTFQHVTSASPVTLRLASHLEVPADLETIFGKGNSDSPITTLNQQWTTSNLVPLDSPLADIPTIAQAVADALKNAGYGTFDLDGGSNTLRAIDDLILTLRPSNDLNTLSRNVPVAVLVGLGILATETAKRAFGGGVHGGLDESYRAFRPCNTLFEAKGFPVLSLTSGHTLQIARKVQYRYSDGQSESLAALFEQASLAGASSKGCEMDADVLDTAMGVAGALLNQMLAELTEEGQLGSAMTFSLVDGHITVARLMTENSEQAHGRMRERFERDKAPAAAGGCDVFLRDPATDERTDGIALYVAVAGVEVVNIGIPYVVVDGAVSFPKGVWLLTKPPAGYSLERASQNLLGTNNTYGLTDIICPDA